MNDWFSKLKNAKKTCIVDRNLKKVHFDFQDDKDKKVLVEEYDLTTNCVVRRAWWYPDALKGEGTWEIEVGDPEPVYSVVDKCMIRENPNEPFVSRRITKRSLEWRIRNLPYPIDVYNVKADKQTCSLIVSTTNKKYYKTLPVPDLNRLGIQVEQANVTLSHKFNTLIITYKKPEKLLSFEQDMLNEIEQIEPQNIGGDPNNCATS